MLRLPLSDDGERVTGGIAVCYFEMAEPSAPMFPFFNDVLAQLSRQSQAAATP